MPQAIRLYVRWVDAINLRIGRMTMYLIFAMMGVLLYISFSKTVLSAPPIWGIEIAQYLMVTYYLLGGPYSMQQDAHVRMDLLYGRWSPRKQGLSDTLTSACLVFYLVVLLIGAVGSTLYSIEYGQRNYSAWRPYVWPIKSIMTLGIFLMLLQSISQFFKDWAKSKGKTLV
ncbi:TRAP transporter small permease subunit [Aestuariispira insulae]|uniref:TRAP transporter small permease protein n=1 Tax=Aestuariispira insulae TaxID=1461337 RepID=A0A3D9HW75_9PROT|nr:TRAP transporter small permease subunit [Aestuariispira insulae]RED53763.1 TRAP-type mannitol/chloroaromatic compound transport system permease small subunit [Aestuariispira insulae]